MVFQIVFCGYVFLSHLAGIGSEIKKVDKWSEWICAIYQLIYEYPSEHRKVIIIVLKISFRMCVICISFIIFTYQLSSMKVSKSIYRYLTFRSEMLSRFLSKVNSIANRQCGFVICLLWKTNFRTIYKFVGM